METDAPSRQRHIAVVGGGIAGLSAAYYLVRGRPEVRLTLLEASDCLGGVLSTVHQDGFQVEQSADNFITTLPWGLELCRELGLSDQLVQTNPKCRRTYVVRRGRLCHLPDGFLMMAPTRMWPMALTPILSPLGKLRAAMEYFIPPRRDESDESMAGFVRRRLGREVFDRLVEPLVGAVYAADMERLSVLATLDRFRDMEREYGSLIRAMRAQKKKRAGAPSESGARYSMFVTLRDGLSRLVAAISDRLPAGSVRLGSTVEQIHRRDGKWLVEWTRKGSGKTAAPSGESDIFDGLIVAAPSHVAAPLLRTVDAALADDLATIEHSGTAIVSLGYNRTQVSNGLDAMGAVVPAIEHSPILAVSFSSQKYTHRAPGGKTLLRVFVGGARQPELAEMEDQQLLKLVLDSLEPLLKIEGKPCFVNIAHWPRTMPQYHVGHLDLVARIEQRAAQLPGFALAGNAYHGVGLPDCIHSGQQAADRVLRE